MAALNAHAKQLYADLGKLADDDHEEKAHIGPALASFYNTLLEQAKTQVPGDNLVSSLTPVEGGMRPRVLQAIVGQLTVMLGGFGN